MSTLSVKIWLYFKVCFKAKIGKADGLSRRLDWKVSIKKNNKNQNLIKKQCICSLIEVVIERFKVDVIEKIKIAKGKDEEIVKVVEEMKKAGVKILWGDEWQIEGDLVLKKEKVYIPKDKKLRIEIIQLYYNRSVKNKKCRLSFFLMFFLISFFLFLELRVRVGVTRSRCHTAGHIR